MTESATLPARRPWIAGALTLALPGTGHFYLGRFGAAAALVAGEVLATVACVLAFVQFRVEPWNLYGALAIYVGYRLWAVVRSVFAARRAVSSPWPVRALATVVLFGIYWLWAAHGVAVLVRDHVAHLYHVPTGAMSDTLIPGDRFFADLLFFGEPSRGDVVVFLVSLDGREVNYVKRVVGLPGERIEIRDGAVHIDGRRLEEPYLGEDAPMDDFAPVTVPAGAYFMLGDRRNSSRDSRFEEIGPIPRDRIVGRATVIAYSFDHPGSETRWDRIGRRVR